MARLKLEIVTPDRVVLSTEADYVSLPGAEGEFGVLPGHIPFFAALKLGAMHYQDGKHTLYAALSGGFAEVADNKVQVLVDSAELATEIDTVRAEASLKRAKERLANALQERVNLVRAEAALQRAVNRLHVSQFQ